MNQSDYQKMFSDAYEKGRRQARREYMDDIFLGIERAAGRGIYLPEDIRRYHMQVIGATGTGKSKFLEHIIRQDVKRGNGFCLIDPHGDLYTAIMRFCADNGLEKRVIPFNPTDASFSLGFNPVRRQAQDISYQVGRMCDACLKAWKQENSADTPRLRRWLQRIFHTLAERDLTLVEARYLISLRKNEIRKAITEDLKEASVREDFEWLEELRGLSADRMIQEQLESVYNRIDSFINSEVVRRIFGQQERVLNIRKVMDEGQILLVNLAEQNTLSSDQVDLIGILLVNEIVAAGKSRFDVPEEKRRPFYLYIDEFARFVTRDIARALDEMRKFRLHLILAHQHLGQLKTDDEYVFNSVMTNARTKVVFGGLNHEDVEYMAKEIFFGELDPEQIKLELKRTYFEPKESTRIIRGYSHSKSTGISTGESSSVSIGESSNSGSGQSSGTTLTGDSFFPDTISKTETSSSTSSSGRSRTETTGKNRTENESETEGYSESVVPWIEHIKRQETSSIEFRSLEEQLYIKSAMMKEQETRNALVKMPGQTVKNVKIPFVEDTKAGKNLEKWFLGESYKAHGILTHGEISKEIERRQIKLKELASGLDRVELDTKSKKSTKIKTNVKFKPQRNPKKETT